MTDEDIFETYNNFLEVYNEFLYITQIDKQLVKSWSPYLKERSAILVKLHTGDKLIYISGN